MNMGELSAALGEIRLDDMKGFGGRWVDKDILWKLLFSYVVNSNPDDDVPDWVDLFYKDIVTHWVRGPVRPENFISISM